MGTRVEDALLVDTVVLLAEEIGGHVASWNDRLSRKHQDVIGILDQCIAKVE